jgi:hypothetical protein
MTEDDYSTFKDWFEILAITHRLGARGEILEKMKGEYFDVLRMHDMDRVRRAYEKLRRSAKRWPVPADWCEALPPHDPTERLPTMTRDQIRESDEAEAKFYEGDVCHCTACVAAHADHLPIRDVPRLDAQGEMIAMRHPKKRTPVYVGRWIHGQELKRWWGARGQFFSTFEHFKADHSV